MEQFYRNSASERIAILSALASHFSNKGQADKRHRKDLFQKATDCLNAADKINRSSEGGKHDATLALGRGAPVAVLLPFAIHPRSLLWRACRAVLPHLQRAASCGAAL